MIYLNEIIKMCEMFRTLDNRESLSWLTIRGEEQSLRLLQSHKCQTGPPVKRDGRRGKWEFRAMENWCWGDHFGDRRNSKLSFWAEQTLLGAEHFNHHLKRKNHLNHASTNWAMLTCFIFDLMIFTSIIILTSIIPTVITHYFLGGKFVTPF